MLWNELLRKGNISLLQSQSDTQYCICRNYNPNAKEDQQYDGGSYFCYWGDKERKPYFLSAALENFRIKTEEEKDEFLKEIHSNDSGWLPEELATVCVINDYNYTLSR